MSLKTEWVRYGDQTAYLTQPERATAPLPAIVVIQEIWGVDTHIQDVTRRFASAGYAALAPDLYAEGGTRPDVLSPARIAAAQQLMNGLAPAAWMDPAARETALLTLPEPHQNDVRATLASLFGGLAIGVERFVPSLLAATRFLRYECDATRGQRIGCVGFCMGGGLSALLACRDPEMAAAVVFYGRAPAAEDVANAACPILGLYGGLDQRINAGIPDFDAAMRRAGKRLDVQVYEGAPHAFFNDTRPSYHVAAARDAFSRTLELFRHTLP